MSPVRALIVAAAGFSIAATCSAQYAISTHSGLVQLTMGTVYLRDAPVHKTITNLLGLGNGDVIRTGEDGLAEVLLTPGVFLRVGHNSSLRMDSNSLTDTKMTMLSGSAMVEADDLLPDNKLSFQVGKEPVDIVKKGLYRLDGNPASVATIQGELFVGGDINEVVKKGKDLRMDASAAELAQYHVDKKEELYTFSQARSEDSAYATGVTTSGFAQSGYSAANGCNSSWNFMGAVGMYSYLPCGGIINSPFGYGFYGLNSAYLWDGPGYYVPPFALLSGYNPGLFGLTSTGAGIGNGIRTATTTNVPVYSGPRGITSLAASRVFSQSALRTMTSAGPSMRSASSMSPARTMAVSAGSSVGHVAAVSSSGTGRYSPAYSGGSNGGGGLAAAPANASSRASVSSPAMSSRAGASSGGHR
ncbi:MAG: hypothetical protein WA324_28960 [Bryobacteraceae bacterium]